MSLPARYTEADCCLDDFLRLLQQRPTAEQYPLAARLESRVPVYECESLDGTSLSQQASLICEWREVLLSGPGVFLLRRPFRNLAHVDQVTHAFQEMVSQQRATRSNAGDHFGKPGENDRVWNALEKLCVHSPEAFALYYANSFLGLAATAWLGPNYQVTSQLNIVNPGSGPQSVHRDYHLGLGTPGQASGYPPHLHHASMALTLQAAIAHCDMPLESGPTRLLPYSQLYDAGYVAWQREDFREVFERCCVQLPLERGDAVFFSPALFHAAGENLTSDLSRIANLLQISSAFGRAMESVDRTRMSLTLYPVLQRLVREGRLDRAQRDWVIQATAEGYAFPTNLDRDPPIGGQAPASQQDLFRQALDEGHTEEQFRATLATASWRRKPN